MSLRRFGLLAILAAAVIAFFALDLDRVFTLAAIQALHARLDARVAEQPLVASAVFVAAYVASTALSLPGATLLTLLGGALFGLGWGFVLVSFASTIGATLAFLTARFLLRDAVQRRFGTRLAALNHGIERDGGFYLFTIRLVPVFPFFLVNVLMGLTPLRTRTFFWVSQLGMAPATLLYVNAGGQLAQIDALRGIASPGLLVSFAALGVLPLAARRGIDWLQARRVYRGWRRPRRFDRNLIVIGGGSAGLVTAYIAAAVRATVTLVERDRMGGDCLNTGCVPSKALIRTGRLLAQARASQRYGVRRLQAEVDFAEVMERVAGVIRRIEPHDSVDRYRGLGVDVVRGEATVVSPWEVEVRGDDGRVQRLSARNLVIATGAWPTVPPIPGLAESGYLTSETVWSLREPPGRLLVLGGGPIGCELAQAFARIGVPVILVEMASRLMTREDPEASSAAAAALAADGVDLRLGHRALRFERDGGGRTLVADRDGHEVRLAFDTVLVALGRTPRATGFGLEALGIVAGERGTLEVDPWLRTRMPNVYACGDVASPYQFTHAAAHMAWYCAVNALFGRLRRYRVDWSVIPWCTFTDPEIARVGLSEQEAKARGIAVEVTRYGIDDLDRAIADSADNGFVKVLTAPGSDKVLGVTIVAEHAGELIGEYVSAMKHGLGLERILGTIHVYPTMSEANRFAAGQWKRAHAPQRLLGWVERWHRWQRG